MPYSLKFSKIRTAALFRPKVRVTQKGGCIRRSCVLTLLFFLEDRGSNILRKIRNSKGLHIIKSEHLLLFIATAIRKYIAWKSIINNCLPRRYFLGRQNLSGEGLCPDKNLNLLLQKWKSRAIALHYPARYDVLYFHK
jgi:hypothetical protein